MSVQNPVFVGNQRVHIGLNVRDLRKSRAFYEVLLGVQPSKERPGYIKFEPEEPLVHLSLNEVARDAEAKRFAGHFGIQVKSEAAVAAAQQRLEAAGLTTTSEKEVDCCYALQTKVWAQDPEGNAWEVFVVLDAEGEEACDPGSACCPN